MRRLVVVGNGHAASAFLDQMQRFQHDFCITVFTGVSGARKPPHQPAWYRSRGIDVRAGVSITAIDRHARVALGDDGSRTTFDRLILATGRWAADRCAIGQEAIGQGQLRPAGLAARSGVMVNHSLESSDGHIYAIGDCAEICDATLGAPHPVSLEQMARRLAARLAAEAVGVEIVVKIPKYKMSAERNLNASAAGSVLTA